MKDAFKGRAWLSALQIVLDAIVAYILWSLQACAAIGMLVFVWMGAQMVIESHRTFLVPSAERLQSKGEQPADADGHSLGFSSHPSSTITQQGEQRKPPATESGRGVDESAAPAGLTDPQPAIESRALPTTKANYIDVSKGGISNGNTQGNLDSKIASTEAIVNRLPPAAIAEGPKPEEGTAAAESLHIAFQGLEFVLFAPLFFLLLRSLTQYLIDLTMKECDHRDRQPSGEANAPGESSGGRVQTEVGKQSLLDAKTLSIGLLFAIVATHLVGRLLSGKFATGSNTSWQEVIVGLSLLVFLATAYLRMESITHKKGGHK